MADNGTAVPSDLNTHHGKTLDETKNDPYFPASGLARALRDSSLNAASGGNIHTPLDSTSEEDYDDESCKPIAIVVEERARAQRTGSNLRGSTGVATPSDTSSESGQLDNLKTADLGGTKVFTVAADDKELRDILRRGLQRAKEAKDPQITKARPGKFSEFVFTRKLSTFDRQNELAANSPFHGFFTLFWIGLTLFMLKIGAENWKSTGNPLGTNDIMKHMFRRDVVLLLASDGIMCGLTGVSWVLQILIHRGYSDWNGSGWIIQNIWQTIFIGANIGWTRYRDWPWSHTVFFILHVLIMLMKQHSYAFYNGYLSTVYKARQGLLRKLKQLENVEAVDSSSREKPSIPAVSTSHLSKPPSASQMKQRRQSIHSGNKNYSADLVNIEAAIKSGKHLDLDQIQVFEQIIGWEIDGLTEELKGKSTSPENAYPNNLTLTNYYLYIVFPTLVYELEYPRSDSINWFYVAEKLTATFGVIFVMMMVSQAFIYPVVMKTVAMKESEMSLSDRFQEFPWLLSDLVFPLMMEYLLTWYLIWEAILNLLGELTYFADRTFYDAWWNSVSWDQFARDWNRPVHNFLLRHVYHSSISAMKVNKNTATLITFFLSACVHELVMWCIFKKLRGYLLMLQMFQLPLVSLSRTKWLKGKATLGNVIFWIGIFTGPSILCSLYLVL